MTSPIRILPMIALALTCSLSSLAAFAETDNVTISVDSTNAVQTYTADGSGTYTPSSVSGTQHQVITGEGMLAALAKDETTALTPLSAPNYDRITFSTDGNGGYTMNRSFHVEIPTQSGAPVVIDDSYSGGFTFVTGSWDDYQAGKPTLIAMSPDCAQKALGTIQKKLQGAMSAMQAQLASVGKASPIAIDQLTPKAMDYLILSQKSMTQVGGGATTQMHFSITINTDGT